MGSRHGATFIVLPFQVVEYVNPDESVPDKTILLSKSSKLGRKRWLGSSLPEKLNRPAWYLDFPKWQEIKSAWNNGGGGGGQKMAASDRKTSKISFDALLENSSRHASVTSDSNSDPFEYDMSNRAQLPRGIENIRPHLETMDNVPLLVSLFTDCTPESTTEMLKIMQEYGEVVCVIGSSANYRNIDAFLHSDASLAIEPRYPQLCQKVSRWLNDLQQQQQQQQQPEQPSRATIKTNSNSSTTATLARGATTVAH